MKKKQKGFTLIEILIVIGLIAILATVVLVALNPARQFAQARNSQRTSNVNSILNAVGQNIADNKGTFTCSGTYAIIDGTTRFIRSLTTTSSTATDLRSCIVPTYMAELPVDPSSGTACADSASCPTYNTDYTIVKDATTGRITISAPTASTSEPTLFANISVTR